MVSSDVLVSVIPNTVVVAFSVDPSEVAVSSDVVDFSVVPSEGVSSNVLFSVDPSKGVSSEDVDFCVVPTEGVASDVVAKTGYNIRCYTFTRNNCKGHYIR
jgi:hypothetical protein